MEPGAYGYNWATLSLVEHKYTDLVLQVGVGWKADVQRSETRMTEAA
jgi:hypothetical protein